MAITYCLVCNITGEKYYGSSTTTLEVRLSKHKGKSNTCVSKQIISRGNYDIFQLGEYETELEAKMKEKWYINNKNCINKNNVCLTDEERKEYGKERHKQYYENNREEINERNKQYREKNKEQIREKRKEYREQNKEQISEAAKKRRENNVAKFIEKERKYYRINKDKINEKKRERVKCEICGKELNKHGLTRHKKSFHFDTIVA